MQLRPSARWRALVVPLAVALTFAACGGDDDAAGDGPTITVGSFNFGESVTLAEIYAQAMEDAGHPVARELNLGARELIYEDLKSGAIDFLPEYVGSALSVGFSADASPDTDEAVAALRDEFEPFGITVLEPAPAQDKNAFVVTADFAEANDVTAVSDLASVEDVTFAGPPECEDRTTCFGGLRDEYGLDNLTFESIQETPIRVSSLRNEEIDVALMFTTDPPLQESDLVVLEEDAGIVAAENVTPVVHDDILEAYGDDLINLVNSISAALTTDDLIAMNTDVYVDGADSAVVARNWLVDNGFLDE